MNTHESSFEFDVQDYGPELIETLQEYLASKAEESVAFELVTADLLPTELKEAMGLDMFPEDIQNDILALARKLTDYALNLVAQSEEETPSNPAFGKLVTCIQKAPYRDIARDALKGARTADRVGKLLPGPSRAFIGPVGGLTTAAAAWAGSVIGCTQSPTFTKTRSSVPKVPIARPTVRLR